jgi:hypothetical protein
MGITVNVKFNSVQIRVCRGFPSWKEKTFKKIGRQIKHSFIFAVTHKFKTMIT